MLCNDYVMNYSNFVNFSLKTTDLVIKFPKFEGAYFVPLRF